MNQLSCGSLVIAYPTQCGDFMPNANEERHLCNTVGMLLLLASVKNGLTIQLLTILEICNPWA